MNSGMNSGMRSGMNSDKQSGKNSSSKYQRLQDYLEQANQAEVSLTFEAIETLIAERLPKSARQNQAWWSNRSKGAVQAKAWMGAGFIVETVDLEAGTVLFRKPSAAYQLKRDGDTIKWNADLIKGLRRHLGLSQAELAARLGVRQQTISDWEVNAYDPRRAMSKYLSLVADQVGFHYGAAESPSQSPPPLLEEMLEPPPPQAQDSQAD